MAKSLTIRKGDRVRVIAGKDKGKESRVLKVHPEKGRAVVEKVQDLVDDDDIEGIAR